MGKQQNSEPVYFSPKGLSDALDSTDEFPGAMASLQNLVFDPSTANVFQCRPAAVALLQARFPNPILSFGFVSVFVVIGDVLYGMVGSRLNPGFDQPFALNLLTGVAIIPTGITAANVPKSQPSSGDWVPPTMDLVGTKLVVTHPGFAQGVFGTATDRITFSANPNNGDTITLNGSVVTFVTATPVVGNNQVQILASLQLTLASLPAALAAFGDPQISQCTYSASATVLLINYRVSGASGNNFTVAASVAVPLTPTLTGGSGNYFGWFDISIPLAPVWNAGNTAINPLVVPPTAVAQFNSRAYFLLNPAGGQPGLAATDALDPTTMTNGTYILTFGDSAVLTALAGLPLTNQLGGIIQSIIVFKGLGDVYQVTGDPAPNTAAGPWTKNALNVATGTLAPRSIVSTPQGLMFMSPEGYRLISFDANVSTPIGANGKGITTPFINCPVPSRVAAASNAALLRVSLTNVNGQQQEFWLDIARGVWTGPHTFPANMIAPYKNTFIIAPIALPNSIQQSDWIQNSGSTFTEAGTPLQWTYQTSFLPDLKDMKEHEFHEISILLSTATGATATAGNEKGDVIESVSIGPAGVTTNWGAAMWQSSIWAGQAFSLGPVSVPWTSPVVFGRATLQFTGVSDSVTRIGAMGIKIEQTGYLPQPGV